MIKAVFFDVGGTLIHPFPSVGEIYSQTAMRHGVCVPADQLNVHFKNAWAACKKHRLHVDKIWWRDVVRETFHEQTFGDFDAFFEDVYATFASKKAWCVFPDVTPTLDELCERGLKLAVLSNWDERLPTLLKTLGLDTYFERQFISFEMGLLKPNPQFFQRALQSLDLHPLETIHVGDDVEEDVKGAQTAGIRAYHLNRQKRPLNSREMSTLSEILSKFF